MTLERKQLGREGETAAAQYLEDKGYRVLYRNFRTRIGEIDLICEKDAIVVFVEVRSKRSNRFGSGAESVNWKKQQKVRLVAQVFLSHKQWFDRPVRFDVIDVHFSPLIHIQQIENAF